jgi:tRNA1Val (adenine37-N6)-methyltransferase
MKVGTDAVLLGSWVEVSKARRILEVGTGSGVIALMLAQRTGDEVQIDALEIEKEDAAQARENVLGSPWPNKVSVFKEAFQEFNSGVQYDLIVSNPPFFTNSLLPPSPHRTRTRHSQQLTFDELISDAIPLMKATGTLAVILPFQEGNDFRQLAFKNGLHIQRQLAFYTRKDKAQERWLFEFGFTQGQPKEEKLVLYDKANLKSSNYLNLTKDFYL